MCHCKLDQFLNYGYVFFTHENLLVQKLIVVNLTKYDIEKKVDTSGL